jgi:hypothetical protein
MRNEVEDTRDIYEFVFKYVAHDVRNIIFVYLFIPKRLAVSL